MCLVKPSDANQLFAGASSVILYSPMFFLGFLLPCEIAPLLYISCIFQDILSYSFTFFFCFVFLIFKTLFNWRIITILYRFLPYINMNQPQVYKCHLPLESSSHLPPPIPPLQVVRALGLSPLCHTANLHWVPILYMVVYVSILLSQFTPPSPSLTVPTNLFYMSVFPLLPCT